MEEGKTTTEEKLDLGEVSVDEGFRGELVSQADIKLVLDMSKDDLEEYVITRFGTTLNLSEKIKMLRLKVVNMIRDKLKIEPDAKPNEKTTDGVVETAKNPEFIFNPANRRVFEWTPILGEKKNYIVCYIVDKDGKRL
jgi:hypothetical protein